MIKVVSPPADPYGLVQTWEITFPKPFIEVCMLLEITPAEVFQDTFKEVYIPKHIGMSLWTTRYSIENVMKMRHSVKFKMEEIEQMLTEAYAIEKLSALIVAGEDPMEAWRKMWLDRKRGLAKSK